MPLRTPYHMLMRPLPLAPVAPGRTALVLIDVQAFTCRRGHGLDAEAARRGITGELDEYYLQVEAALRNIARVLVACRAAALQVIHIRAAAVAHQSRQFAASGLHRPAPDATDEDMEQAAPIVGERVIARGAYSAFLDTGLAEALHQNRIETLILAGMMANVILPLAAREAADRNFNVLVMPDCCASETLDWHALTLQGLVGGAIRVSQSGDVIAMIGGEVR
jgi:nicotinamidase-related amidase